jgi:hypothetical protein
LTGITRAKGGPLDGTYDALARKYGVTPGKVALRWIIDQGMVAITTSGNEDRLRAYQKVSQFKLTPKEVEEISEIGQQKHFQGFWKNRFAPDDRSCMIVCIYVNDYQEQHDLECRNGLKVHLKMSFKLSDVTFSMPHIYIMTTRIVTNYSASDGF